MSAPRYFVYPFGQDADDLTSIPDAAAMDGSVSYQDGWTPPYELDLLTQPSALPIPRGQMNQLFFDITSNLQELQKYGSPMWYSGVSYPINSKVYHSDLVYESQVGSNTATPGVDDTWLVISGASFKSINISVLTATGTYTPTAGMVSCIVELVAPGGGGAGCTSTGGNMGIGGPGGAGGYSKKSYTAEEIGASGAAVLPAGGAGGTAGNSGTSGSNATFTPSGSGTVITANGGVGGVALNTQPIANSISVAGGAGGSASGGDVNILGGNGSYSGAVAGGAFSILNQGGSPALYGNGAAAFITNDTNPGESPKGFGGGGGGSFTLNSANQVGVQGGNAYLVITEFLS